MNRRHHRLRRDSGQAIVEFALASLVFFMTIFGIIEFGMAIWQYNMVSNLAQEGARWASVRGSTTSIPAGPVSAADVETFVRGRSVGITVTVTTTPEPSTLKPGQLVSVLVRTDFTPLTPLLPLATLTLQSRASMVMSR
jgi:Flp pilus assembly protein TadG